jgi:hypothetical protein
LPTSDRRLRGVSGKLTWTGKRRKGGRKRKGVGRDVSNFKGTGGREGTEGGPIGGATW